MAENADNTPETSDDIAALLADATSKADRTRKNAIKQMRTTATKLKNSAEDSPDPVRDHAEQVAQNLYDMADFLEALAVDQTTPVLPEPAPETAETVPKSPTPPKTPPASPQTSQQEEELFFAFTPQQIMTGAAFFAGMLVGLVFRRK